MALASYTIQQNKFARQVAHSKLGPEISIDSATVIDDMDPAIKTSTTVKGLIIKHAIVLGNFSGRIMDTAIVFIPDKNVNAVKLTQISNALIKAKSGVLVQRD